MNKRLEWLDAVKGICIILIMISHYCNIPYIGYYLFAGYVPIFFIASGYTFNTEFKKEKIIKRMKRLLIPYFFYGSLFWFILFLFKKQSIVNLAGLIYSRYCLFPIGTNDNILLLGCNSPLWFLTALFCATLSTYFFFHFKSNKIKILCACIYIAISFLMSQLSILLPWSLDTSFIAALFMIIGYYIKQNKLLSSIGYKFLPIIILTVIYILLVYYNPNINISVREYGSRGIIIFGLIGFIEFVLISKICQILETSWVTRFLSKIGKSSLRILCIHYPLFILISPYLTNNIYVNSIVIGGGAILFAIITENKLSKYNL